MELKEIRQELKEFFESGIKPDNLNDKSISTFTS